MSARNHQETLARHSGPFLLVSWKRPPDPKANKGLPFRYNRKAGIDPIAEAIADCSAGAECVNIWSVPEQQFVTTVRPGDSRGEEGTVVGPVPAVRNKGRAGEYFPIPGAEKAIPNLPAILGRTLEVFVELGSATVAEVAKRLERETDPIASHATRLKGMGLLKKEE